MRIGLLQCDHVSLDDRIVAQGDYDEIYARVLVSASSRLGMASPVEVRSYAVVDGVFPKKADNCDAWVVSSSRFDVLSSLGWIQTLRYFVRKIADAGLPLVGICFGHQLIAQSFGGKIKRRSNWIAGVQRVGFSDNPIFSSSEVKLFGIHRDEVVEPPPSALVFGSTKDVAIAAYMIGSNVLGIQYHIDLSVQYLESLLRQREKEIGRKLYERAKKGINIIIDDEDVSADLLAFMMSSD